MPVKVKIVGYNPFIPGNADDSGIPLQYSNMKSKTLAKTIEVSISQHPKFYRKRW